jgi:acetyl esterase/lipase
MRMRTTSLGLATLLAACGGDVEERREVYDDRFSATAMDVYLPGDGATGRPVVMFIHGGGWKMGSASHHTAHARRLAEDGYVTVSIDYRLVPDGVFPRQVQDSQCALSFVRAHADEWGLDPARVAVIGYSAGGHLVSMLGVASDHPELQTDCAAGPTGAPQAVISGAGPEDLRGWGDYDAPRQMLGVSVEDDPDRWALASPITHARADAPPFLFIHGADDWFVPIEQSRAMREALVERGVDARLLSLAGAGHLTGLGGTGGREELGVISIDSPESWLALSDFLADTVGVP